MQTLSIITNRLKKLYRREESNLSSGETPVLNIGMYQTSVLIITAESSSIMLNAVAREIPFWNDNWWVACQIRLEAKCLMLLYSILEKAFHWLMVDTDSWPDSNLCQLILTSLESSVPSVIFIEETNDNGHLSLIRELPTGYMRKEKRLKRKLAEFHVNPFSVYKQLEKLILSDPVVNQFRS